MATRVWGEYRASWFRRPRADGMWRGFDVDYCRAIAAAIFNDASKVEFRPLSAQHRFTALQSGEIDVLSRNTTWTLSRDASLGLDFGPTLFYDGQGMMMPVELHWKLGSLAQTHARAAAYRAGPERRVGLRAGRNNNRIESGGLLSTS